MSVDGTRAEAEVKAIAVDRAFNLINSSYRKLMGATLESPTHSLCCSHAFLLRLPEVFPDLDKCIKSVKGISMLASPIVTDLPFIERPDSFPKSKLQGFVMNELPTNLLDEGSERAPVVVVIHAGSGAGKSAILDNINVLLGKPGEVLIVKATYNLDQSLAYDREQPERCLFLRFLTHLDHEASLGKYIEDEVLAKHYDNKRVNAKMVAEKALQQMKSKECTRIAFVVDEVVNLCKKGKEEDGRSVMSALSGLIEAVATINAKQKNPNSSRFALDDVVACAMVTALPTLDLTSLVSNRRCEEVDSLSLTPIEAFSLAKATVRAYASQPGSSSTFPDEESKARCVRQAVAYGSAHARSIIGFVAFCVNKSMVPPGSQYRSSQLSQNIFSKNFIDNLPSEDMTNSFANFFKLSPSTRSRPEERRIYKKGYFTKLPESNRLHIPFGLMSELESTDPNPLVAALGKVIRDLPEDDLKASEELYARLLLVQAHAEVPAFPPGVKGKISWKSDGNFVDLDLNKAHLAIDKSQPISTESFLKTGISTREIPDGFDIERMKTEMFIPKLTNHPSFEFSFPIKINNPSGEEVTIVVLVQMTKAAKTNEDITSMILAAGALQQQGLTVMPMLISRNEAEGLEKINHLVVPDRKVDELFTPTFAGYYRALTGNFSIAGRKFAIEAALNTAGERSSPMTPEEVEETKKSLEDLGSIFEEDASAPGIDFVVCSVKKQGDNGKPGWIGWRAMKEAIKQGTTSSSVPLVVYTPPP